MVIQPMITMSNEMQPNSKIYVAGHRGLVGSAIMRRLAEDGYTNVVTRTHDALDLSNQVAVREFFEQERPEYVFLAAAKVGGILANTSYPAEFIYQNLMIQSNTIHSAYLTGVKRLLFLGSSCIYPRDCPQPIKEEYLLTGPLEPTNRPYALAKIAGIEQCWSYNRQYGTRYLAVMPTNLYGPGDNYDLNNSHVIPALIRKFHEAKVNRETQVVVWGTGTPRREFLYSDDMAGACVMLMNLPDAQYCILTAGDASAGQEVRAPIVNIGVGEDVSILELAERVKRVVGYEGGIILDQDKPDGTPRKLLDISRLASTGWKPRVTLTEGIALSYASYRASLA